MESGRGNLNKSYTIKKTESLPPVDIIIGYFGLGVKASTTTVIARSEVTWQSQGLSSISLEILRWRSE
jgi:hypothetical protein